MALTRRAIVEAGLRILDEYGLGDLSMRRVADALGVQAGALYYHVPNKQSLLAAVADEILAAQPPADEQVGPIVDWLASWAHGLRRRLLAHRDAAELVASTHALGLGAVDPCAAGRAGLEREGAPEPAATMAALLHFVLGHVVEEQTQAQMHELGVVANFDPEEHRRNFAWGLSLFTSGVAAQRADG